MVRGNLRRGSEGAVKQQKFDNGSITYDRLVSYQCKTRAAHASVGFTKQRSTGTGAKVCAHRIKA